MAMFAIDSRPLGRPETPWGQLLPSARAYYMTLARAALAAAAAVDAEEKKAPEVVVVPLSVVANDQTGPYLFVVGADNKAEQRRVKLGIERYGMIVVEDGLKPGEKMIVQGQQRVRPGMVVAPQPAPGSAPATQPSR